MDDRMLTIVDLPPEILELLFEYLDEPKDILNLISTCHRFKEIVESSDKLTKKLTIYVSYPSFLNSFKAMIRKSKRRYRNLSLTRLRCRSSDIHFSSLTNAFETVGPCIKNLTLNWCPLRNLDITTASLMDITARRRIRAEIAFQQQNIAINRPNRQSTENQGVVREDIRDELYKEFVTIIKHFTNLEKTAWNNVNIEKRGNSSELSLLDFSSLRELKLKQCDAYCFEILLSANQLLHFEISEPFWSNNRNPGIDNFETFLVSQANLKHLYINSIQYPRIFHTDRSDSIRFQLNHLVLKNVFFKEKENAEKFFMTQKHLKSIDIQVQNEKVRNLDELNWYNNIIKTVLSQNSMLKTINIDKIKYKIPNCDFLNNAKNTNVRELNFNVIAEDRNAELFKSFIRILPNLDHIAYKSDDREDNDGDECFDKGTVLENVKTLVIVNASVKSLMNIYAENLHTFEYSPKLNGKYIDDYIGGFLHSHRNIKDLRIGSKTGRSYFFVSYNLCQLIVNFLNQLESITIYNFAEVNKSVKLMCSLSNLNTLTLSSLQYQQFTAKTKVECDRMKLKLIPVEINFPFETRDFFDS